MKRAISLTCLFFILFTLPINSQENTDINTLQGFIEEGFTSSLTYRQLLMNFQAKHNLNVDGLIGWDTDRVLDSYEWDHYVVKVHDKLPVNMQNCSWFIVINKDLKILTLYHYGDVFGKYPVALGKSTTPTPNCKFTIVNKAVNPAWSGLGKGMVAGGDPSNPLGHRWMGLSKTVYAGYGIHGNSNPWSIGEYASSGCIRMSNAHVETIYDYIPLHTPVWIGTSAVLESWGISQNIQIEDLRS